MMRILNLFSSAISVSSVANLFDPPRGPAVTVYTRRDCCCCHKAIEVLKEYRRKYGLRIVTVDIDADDDLRAKYDTTVPVVAIGGKVRFKGVVNRVLLERILEAEGKGA
jgi:glutaredoxin